MTHCPRKDTVCTPPSILEKVNTYQDAEQFRKAGIYPYFRAIQSSAGADVHIGGEKKIMIGSNNYLGLTTHPEVIAAAQNAIATYGTGCTGSRFLNGTLDIHLALEAELAHFLQKEDVLVVTTGFQTNLSVISALAGRHDIVFLDEENHASIIDGCRLSFGRMVRYRHNDTKDLERLLKHYATIPGKLIVTDGVFSMSGDIAHLPALTSLAKQHDALLMVDDAHGVGVFGPNGEGTAHHFGCHEQVDIITGTFSKSFASIGGYIASNRAVIDYIRHRARPYMFSASLPPAAVATARACLEIVQTDPTRRRRLWENVAYVISQFKSRGISVTNDTSPIIPILIGPDMLTFAFNEALFKAGIFANPVISPAVPSGKGLIRTSYMSTHTPEELDTVADIVYRLFREFSLHSTS